MSESISRVQPRLKPVIYFWRGLSQPSGRLESGVKEKAQRQNINALATIVGRS